MAVAVAVVVVEGAGASEFAAVSPRGRSLGGRMSASRRTSCARASRRWRCGVFKAAVEQGLAVGCLSAFTGCTHAAIDPYAYPVCALAPSGP